MHEQKALHQRIAFLEEENETLRQKLDRLQREQKREATLHDWPELKFFSSNRLSLLKLLAAHAGQCVSRERLESVLTHQSSAKDGFSEKTLDVYICSIRRTIRERKLKFQIVTHHRVGFSLHRAERNSEDYRLVEAIEQILHEKKVFSHVRGHMRNSLGAGCRQLLAGGTYPLWMHKQIKNRNKAKNAQIALLREERIALMQEAISRVRPGTKLTFFPQHAGWRLTQ
jgi:DNA-binding winged helix-turn-helix (wHTH) protein